MKAVRIHSYGGNETVRVEDIAIPSPGPNELLIKVTAAAVNPVDWKIREGYLRENLPIEFPYTLGCDVSGTVEQLGPGATRFSIGDAVFGYPHLTRCGAFAEYALVLETEMALAPTSIPLDHAAALPVAGITAWDGLYTHGKLEPGQTVLILGGAGGVGSAAIQLARWTGAGVYATASSRNQAFLRELGATPIDYSTQATVDLVRNADLIFDCVGIESGLAALPSLRPGGAYVSSTYALPPAETFVPYAAHTHIYGIQPSGDRLREIVTRVDSGHLRVVIDRTYPLDQAAEALAVSQAGRTRGKLLLRP